MNTVTFKNETIGDLIDVNMFCLVYGREIENSLLEEAYDANTDIWSYLMGKYPNEDITIDNEKQFMVKAFLDRLSRANVIL